MLSSHCLGLYVLLKFSKTSEVRVGTVVGRLNDLGKLCLTIQIEREIDSANDPRDLDVFVASWRTLHRSLWTAPQFLLLQICEKLAFPYISPVLSIL